MTKPRMFSSANPPAPPVADTGEKPVMTEMEQLKALLAKFGKADIAKLVKEVSENKQTILSVTMDCIVAAGDTVITDTVTKAVTKAGRECGVLDEKDEASVTSVAQLIRHVQAYRSAVKRFETKGSDDNSETGETSADDMLDVSLLNETDPSYVSAS